MDVSFSLTERCVINPVLYLRADRPKNPDQPVKLQDKVLHAVEKEFLARLLGATVFVFATADFFLHLSTAAYKKSDLLIREWAHLKLNPSCWTHAETNNHCKRAALFLGVIFYGLFVGTVAPDVLKNFRYTPPVPPASTKKKEKKDKDPYEGVPAAIRALAENVISTNEKKPFNTIKAFWNSSSLTTRHWFVHVFGKKSAFRSVRDEMVSLVYRPIATPKEEDVENASKKTEVKWPAPITSALLKTKAVSKAFFFHATSVEALESILKTGKIEVRHEKAYRGAFVSTKPETTFGKYILAFKSDIERLSRLEHGFTVDQKTYWAGFSYDIPVNANTLACIIVDSTADVERSSMATYSKEWTGREIEIVLLKDATKDLPREKDSSYGIPQEWPNEDEKVGQAILAAMKPQVVADSEQEAATPPEQVDAVTPPTNKSSVKNKRSFFGALATQAVKLQSKMSKQQAVVNATNS